MSSKREADAQRLHVPLRKSNREAAGLEGGETIDARPDLDRPRRHVSREMGRG